MAIQTRKARVLITAGPTHEPIDAVRYLANRSSGTLGLALAARASARGLETRLLLGPVPCPTESKDIQLQRFKTTADLQALLKQHAPWADLIIMAAAVADFRPISNPASKLTKIRRTESGLSLELEPTPDLLAQISAQRPNGQIIVGFALEPADRLESSARDKLNRKDLDFIVANPLETMDSAQIEATLLARDSSSQPARTPGKVSKEAFADWLLDRLAPTAPDS